MIRKVDGENSMHWQWWGMYINRIWRLLAIRRNLTWTQDTWTEWSTWTELCTQTDDPTVQSMIADAKLTHKIRAKAITTAMYLKNWSLTKAVEELLHSKLGMGKTVVNHLLIGCHSYAHVAKDEQQKCLGYGSKTKGYQLYDLKHSEVLYIFLYESEPGFEKEPSAKEERQYVEIVCSSEKKKNQY